jgi:hypothetical protein
VSSEKRGAMDRFLTMDNDHYTISAEYPNQTRSLEKVQSCCMISAPFWWQAFFS